MNETFDTQICCALLHRALHRTSLHTGLSYISLQRVITRATRLVCEVQFWCHAAVHPSLGLCHDLMHRDGSLTMCMLAITGFSQETRFTSTRLALVHVTQNLGRDRQREMCTCTLPESQLLNSARAWNREKTNAMMSIICFNS